MQPIRFLTAAIAVAAAAGAQSITIPAGLANVEGNSSTAYPWSRAASVIQVQYCYDSSHFTSQGITFPILINRIKWRANSSATSYTGGTYSNVVIDCSTAAVDQAAVTTTFANNHGLDRANVYTGPATVLPHPGVPAGTPNIYYVDVPITPFLYDPTSGNDFLVDISFPSGSWGGGTVGSVDCQTTGSLTSRVYNLSSNTSATGTIQQNVGLTAQLDYNPASGLYAGFSANVTSGASPLAVQFTDSSFSSAPGGVTAWAWDLDGDTVIDSTLQNPSFIYNNCGTYNVTLTVTDSQHAPSTLTRTAYITTDNITANFSEQVVGPLTVLFTDTSNMPATSWSWDLDGDNLPDSTVQNPAWVYPNANPVNVTLTVTRNCSAPSTITRQIVPLQQISQNMAPNNGLSSGASVYFDSTITNTNGVRINALDVFGSVTNVPFTVDMYVKPGTHVGFEGTAAEWVLAGTASGTSGGTNTTPSNCTFAQPVYLPAGNHGIKLLYNGTGPRYMNLTGLTTVTNGDLSLTLGVSRGTTVANPWGGSNIANRGWSGRIYYDTFNVTGNAGIGTFAPGCPGSLGVPTIAASGNPTLGSTLSLTVNNLPTSGMIMCTGFSNTNSLFGPLPFDATVLGAPGCFLRVSTEAVLFLQGAGNTAVWNLTIPNDPALGGIFFFNQALAGDPLANALGAVASNATAMVTGN